MGSTITIDFHGDPLAAIIGPSVAMTPTAASPAGGKDGVCLPLPDLFTDRWEA